MAHLEADGQKVDRESQLMLLKLEDDGPCATGRLGEVHPDISQSTQVVYRMETHLMPAGLADEVGADERGENEPRLWRLTDEGKQWLQDHRDDVEGAQTLREACAVAEEAIEVAEQAQSSAGSATATVGELETRLDEALSQLERAEESIADLAHESAGEEIEEEMAQLQNEIVAACENAAQRFDVQSVETTQDSGRRRRRRRRRTSATAVQSESIEDALEKLVTAVQKADQRELEPVQDDIDTIHQSLDERVSTLDSRTAEIAQAVEDLDNSVVTLAERIEVVERKADTGLELRDRGLLGRLQWLVLGR